jgi:transketolase
VSAMTRYEQALLQAAEARPELMVLTAENRAALRSLPPLLGPRFLDLGICEQTLVGAAAGLAACGRVPVVHALAAFLTMRAFEFVRTDVGLPGLPVKLVGGVPGLLSEANGPTHQAIEDLALMRLVPHMEIFCPADEDELLEGLPHALASPNPVYVRFLTAPARWRHAPFAWGRAEVAFGGHDVAIVAAGLLVGEAWGAVEALRAQGVGATLVNLRTLAPLDEAVVAAVAREARLLVTLEDHVLPGGVHAAVVEALQRRRVAARVLPLALPGPFAAARLDDVLRREGLRAADLARRISAALQDGT